MTPLPAHAGITAPRRRPGVLSRMRSLLAALLVGVAVMAGAATPARAATPSPSPTASGVVEVTAAPLGQGLLGPQDPLTVQLALTNGTASSAAGGQAVLTLGDAALNDRAALGAWLSGSADVGTGKVLGVTTIEDAAPGKTTTAGILVAADNADLPRTAGVYPLWVTLGSRTARSVITVPGTPTGSVGVVVPITAGAIETGLLTSDQLASLTAADGALTARLDAVSGTAAILAIDPAIPAAIRVLGTAAPETARTWLDRLDALPNERFALAFGDADLSAQIDAGLAAPLGPTSLAAYIDRAHLGSSPSPSATPSPTATGGAEAALPEVNDLLAVGQGGDVAATTYFWPATGTAGPQVVSALAASTPGAVTLLSSAATTEGAHGQTVTARHTVSGANVLVYDTAISAALADAAASTDSASRSAAIAAAAAGMALALRDAAGQPLLVAVDRPAGTTALGLREAIATATASSIPASLAALAAAAPSAATVQAAASDPGRVDAVGQLLAGADRIAHFATILADPALLTGPERASSLQVLGNAWLAEPDAWASALSAHAAATQKTMSSVDILPSTSLNLLTAGTNLRFWVHNDLPYEVNVVLSAIPNDLRLEVERTTTVTAAPASNTPVEVPVHARIGNGEAVLTLELHSPSGESIGTTQVVDVNVRADWENIGIVVLAVIVVTFVAVGVIRTVRRRRAAGGADTPAAAATAETGVGGDESRNGPASPEKEEDTL